MIIKMTANMCYTYAHFCYGNVYTRFEGMYTKIEVEIVKMVHRYLLRPHDSFMS